MKNILTKKVPALLLVLLLLLSALASCTEKGKNEETTASSSEESTTLPDEGDTNDDVAPLHLLKNGVSEFCIVRPYNATEEQEELITYFRDQFEKRTGVRLPIKKEYKNDPPQNDEFEILIGNTGRTESININNSLRKMDSLYCISGNKLILTGGCDTQIKTAVQYFMRKFLDSAVSADKLNITFTASDKFMDKVNYVLDEFKIGGIDAYNYRIVYSKSDLVNSRNFAFSLAKMITTLYGYDIDVVDDSAAETENEIVIGNTKRKSPTFSENGCNMIFDNGKLYFHSSISSAYPFFYEYVVQNVLKSGKTLLIDSAKNISAPLTTLLTGGSENILSRSGDVRIIFNNVWSGNTDSAKASFRATQLAELFADYAPDIIGLQEFSGVVSTNLSKYLKNMGYKEVPYTTRNQNYAVRTPIYYNPNAVELVDSGYWAFNDTANDKSKSIGWGVFKDKNGSLFCVASTHFYWTSDELGEYARQIDAKELCEQMSAVSAKHGGIPIIIGGDYNCNLNSVPLSILKANNFTDIESTAKKTELGGTHHSYPTIDSNGVCTAYSYAGGTYQTAIDHIFSYADENLTVGLYDVIEDLLALASSDHCPLLADITLTPKK